MSALWTIHRLRWTRRIPLKALILALVLLGVTYPNPTLLVRAIRHARNMDALIDDNEPALQPLHAELRDILQNVPPDDHPVRLQRVQQLVCRKIPYDWDWNTWGVVEYTPTVAEVLAMGREDCDGRAVVAASLLKRLGYQPRLVTDLLHVWVWTKHGETMSPGGPKTFDPTDAGRRFNPRSMLNWPTNLAAGLAVFPVPRELILLATIWFLSIHPSAPRWTWALSVCLLLLALLLFRVAADDPSRIIRTGVWAAWASLLTGLALLWRRFPRTKPRD